jgi:hypothetical protein
MGAVTCCVSEVFAAAADRPPQRATAQAIPAAVLRPRTGPKSGPTRGTPSSEANRHETTLAPFDHHMPNIARVYPRVLPPESNSPLPQFPSVRALRVSGYGDRSAWAIPHSRGTGASATARAGLSVLGNADLSPGPGVEGSRLGDGKLRLTPGASTSAPGPISDWASGSRGFMAARRSGSLGLGWPSSIRAGVAAVAAWSPPRGPPSSN